MAKKEGFLIIGSREKPVRFSYANTDIPRAQEEGGTPKYSVSMVWSKSNTALTAKVKAKIEEIIISGKDTLKGANAKTKKFKYPLYDGDEEKPGDPVYKDCMYVNANSLEKPQIVDEKNEELFNPKEEFYSGCYGRGSVNFFPFNKNGGIGIGVGLSNLQKYKDGEKLSSRTTAAEDFADDEQEYETKNGSDDVDEFL